MALTARCDPPSHFSFKAEEWEDWLEDYKEFRILTKAASESGEFQIVALIHHMGGEAKKIFNTFKWGKKKIKKMVECGGQDVEVEEEVDEKQDCYEVAERKYTQYFVINRNTKGRCFILVSN
jgi:hypothetical protein